MIFVRIFPLRLYPTTIRTNFPYTNHTISKVSRFPLALISNHDLRPNFPLALISNNVFEKKCPLSLYPTTFLKNSVPCAYIQPPVYITGGENDTRVRDHIYLFQIFKYKTLKTHQFGQSADFIKASIYPFLKRNVQIDNFLKDFAAIKICQRTRFVAKFLILVPISTYFSD